MYDFISVIIPTHKRNELVTELLEKLAHQDYPKSKYEIIVVSDTETEKLMPLSGAGNVKIFRLDSKGADKKRNFGVSKAKGKIVAFTDDDCIPSKDWLKSINSAFERNPEAAAVEGITEGKRERILTHAIINFDGGEYVTSNMAFRKSEFETIGGFDENYMYFREDSDLAFRLIEKGRKIVFDRKVKVFHPPIKRKSVSILKELRLVKNDIRLYKKHTKLYRKHFGFICRGMVKQMLFAWLIIFLVAHSLLVGLYVLIPLYVILVFMFRYFVGLCGKKFNLSEALLFVSLSYLRDLLFPFFFTYYWASIRP